MAFLDLRRLAPSLAPVLLLLGAAPEARADGPVADEYKVKAAFLFNFAKFVEWPPPAFQSTSQPIGICVLGRNPFGSALEEAVQGKTVSNRTFVIREITETQQAAGCHIVFLGASERKRSRALLEELRGRSILTVGETEDFIAVGGVVSFRLKEAYVRFEIDPAAAPAGLKISSKLLSLAENVKGLEARIK